MAHTMIKVDLDDETAPWNSAIDPWREKVKAAYRSEEGKMWDAKFTPDYWLVKIKFAHLHVSGLWAYKHRTTAQYSGYFRTKREALAHMRSD
jgi:hypothetical protein